MRETLYLYLSPFEERAIRQVLQETNCDHIGDLEAFAVSRVLIRLEDRAGHDQRTVRAA